MNIKGNTILVTGGSSGIGRELARRLHDRGNTVIVGGRGEEELRTTVEGYQRMSKVVVDVTDAGSVAEAVEATLTQHPDLNVLVNNAGIMRIEDLACERDLADAETTIATNLLGTIRMTNALVGHLARQTRPAIVNTSSGLAFVPMFSVPTYCATKAAVHSYTVSLRERLRDQVEVIEIVPPGVQTELLRGQSSQEGFVPLDRFMDGLFEQLDRELIPQEVAVEHARDLRQAEANGKLETWLEQLRQSSEADLAAHARGER